MDDNVSVQSFNTTSDSDRHAAADEKKTKRSHGMKKMSSLVSMLSPANNRVGRALEVHIPLPCGSPAIWVYLPCALPLFG